MLLRTDPEAEGQLAELNIPVVRRPEATLPNQKYGGQIHKLMVN